MPAKYARIPGINVMSTILQCIPVKRTGRSGTSITKTPLKHVVATRNNTALNKHLLGEPKPVVKRQSSQSTLHHNSIDIKRVAQPVKRVVVTKGHSTIAKAIAKIVTATTKVYVLQLEGGYIYVGQSSNVARQIQQHMHGQGAMFTKRHAPTGIILPRLGNVEGAGDSGERQEVLLQMRMHGMQRVRGWKYVNRSLSKSDVADITSNWIEMFNLCRVCMGEGHMAAACKKRKCMTRK